MAILCPSCDGLLPTWLLTTGQRETVCPNCFRGLSLEVFPALFRARQNVSPESLPLPEGEASCYEHSSKRAVNACHHCGRFLCALCEVEMQGQVWCPACFENRRNQPAANQLQTSRTLYDSIALALAFWPLWTFYFPLLTAPVVLYLSVRYWKRPSSIIPRNKWRFVLAIFIALCELGFFAVLIVAAIVQARKVRPQ